MSRIILQVSESKAKGKKAKSPRSIFYSKLMKNLGGQTGDDLANAFTKGESEKFRKLMQGLCDRMEEIEQKSESSDWKHSSLIVYKSELISVEKRINGTRETLKDARTTEQKIAIKRQLAKLLKEKERIEKVISKTDNERKYDANVNKRECNEK